MGSNFEQMAKNCSDYDMEKTCTTGITTNALHYPISTAVRHCRIIGYHFTIIFYVFIDAR